MAAQNIFINIGGFAGRGISQIISGGSGVSGNGKKEEEKRDLQSFSDIQSLIAGDVTISRGEAWSVTIEAEENIIPLISTEIAGGRLKVSASGSFSTTKPIKVAVTVAADINEISLLGSGDLVMDLIDQAKLAVNLQGSGDVRLSGQVQALDLRLMGSGDIKATGLRSDEATITLMGSGDVGVDVRDNVSVTLMGSGDVVIHGYPKKVKTSAMGSGEVTIR